MKALIVDDEYACRSTLQDLLEKYCAPITQIVLAENVAQGLEKVKSCQPEVVFLDVEMPDGTGFDFLSQLPNRPFKVIFTTGHDAFAVKAFRYAAVDYLLKPVNRTELREALEKCMARSHDATPEEAAHEFFQQGQYDKVLIPTADGYEFVNFKEIVAVIADGSYSSLSFTDGRKLMVSRNIGEFEELLGHQGFYRIHHSHLIQVRYLQSIHKKDSQVLMSNGQRLLISSRRKAPFLKFCQQIGLRG